MSEHKTIRRQRAVIFGLVIALVFAIIGVGVAQAIAPPATIHTCTKIKSGVTKVKPVCSSKETGKTWADSAYKDLLNEDSGGTTRTDFTGVDFSGASIPVIHGSTVLNFSGDNFSNTFWWGSESTNFTGANFTGATFYGDGAIAISLAARTAGNYLGANFDFANFTNAKFSGLNALATDFNFGSNGIFSTFDGAIWHNTTCPDQTNSDSKGNNGTCVGHGIP
jgi:hypothetical protein